MPVSLRAKLGLLFLAFVALVLVSVGATLWVTELQATDALVINLAGRQRMLTQKMTWLALARADDSELANSIQLFERTLRALREGGDTLDAAGRVIVLPAAPDPELRAQLDIVENTWVVFRAALLSADLAAMEKTAPQILSQLDVVVSAFETRAQTKVTRLQFIQLLSLASALLLLTIGYRLTKTQVVERLARLDTAAQTIAAGQLASPVPATGRDEIGVLAHALDAMRVQVAAAHDQLETRVIQRTRELDAAFELSQAIVAELDLDTLLDSVSVHARSLTRARAASVCLLEGAPSVLVQKASSDHGNLSRELRQTPTRPLARQVLNGETILQDAGCAACAFLQTHAPGNCAVAPLRSGGKTLGALCVVRDTAEPFSVEEARALTLLANAAAVAIANARLVESGTLQAEQNATLAERERLAAELHDNLAQTLSFLNLKTENAQALLVEGHAAETVTELERVREAITAAFTQVRAALVGLREPSVNGQDLAQRLTECVNEFQHDAQVPVESHLEASALVLTPLVQTQVVHVVREALANTRRHAHAQHVRVCAARLNQVAAFIIEDDGCGFDPKTIASEHHLGLAVMRMRVERCGGQLEITSKPGAGTRICARFPLPS
ncbi:MAG: type IV pili methyl-accepting chemotaxis transducer N-terminal domain-containing protein [Chloroflexi bacterium]|nr:type IV pili methyl-accepting chemotaxis transducer N-terminal domain-containing protein [Chloroflexota bacterium]